jgi:hypothetical protein
MNLEASLGLLPSGEALSGRTVKVQGAITLLKRAGPQKAGSAQLRSRSVPILPWSRHLASFASYAPHRMDDHI